MNRNWFGIAVLIVSATLLLSGGTVESSRILHPPAGDEGHHEASHMGFE